MRYFITVKYFQQGIGKLSFHDKRKTKRRTTRSLLNERTGQACSFINFLLDCFSATHRNFIAQTPTCPTNQLAPGSPIIFFEVETISPFRHCFWAFWSNFGHLPSKPCAVTVTRKTYGVARGRDVNLLLQGQLKITTKECKIRHTWKKSKTR